MERLFIRDEGTAWLSPLSPFGFGWMPLLLVSLGALVIVAFVVAGVLGESGMQSDRRGRWLPLVYYYLATAIGLALLLSGVISGLNGLVQAAFPTTADEFIFSEPAYDAEGNPIEESDREEAEREAKAKDLAERSGLAQGIRGGVTAIVAFPVFFWHLRQARRKEPEWLVAAPRTPDS